MPILTQPVSPPHGAPLIARGVFSPCPGLEVCSFQSLAGAAEDICVFSGGTSAG